MSDNLELYNKVRTVPPKAQKAITGGRLKGMTDINPMWRIKTLTEQFGPCGIGWKYEICKQWTEPAANNEVCAFSIINLYVKVGEKWSEPIPGTGGSALIAKETAGLHTNDECYKMALTDALSVACKALGFGADVYFEKDSTKYDRPQTAEKPAPTTSKPAQTKTIIPSMIIGDPVTANTVAQQQQQAVQSTPTTPAKPKPVNFPAFWAECKKIGYTESDVHTYTKCDSLKDWTREQLASLMAELKAIKEAELKDAQ